LWADPAAMSSAAPSPRPWLAVVGLGEDGRAGLSPTAQAALDGAELVVGGARHLRLAQPLAGETLAWPSPLSGAYPAVLARRGRPTCVLATGDPFFYGVGAELARLVPAAEMACFPQASAFSLAAARLGWSLPDCACVSLHGRALQRFCKTHEYRALLLDPPLDPGGLQLTQARSGPGRSGMPPGQYHQVHRLDERDGMTAHRCPFLRRTRLMMLSPFFRFPDGNRLPDPVGRGIHRRIHELLQRCHGHRPSRHRRR